MSTRLDLIQRAKALHPKKALSQNFLVNDTPLNAITAEVDGFDTSLPIVEIGPGPGFLTEKLLETGHKVTAIDVDTDMIGELTKNLSANPNFTLIHSDVRKIDLLPLISPKGIVIGNLPYHLTGPILFQLTGELEDTTYPLRQSLAKVVIMVQKEVGDRLIAKAGDSAYSQLTLQAQCWFEVSKVAIVPKNNFFPSPKVDSMVVRLVPRAEPAIQTKDYVFLNRIVKTAFMHRRKTLYNNLKYGGFCSQEQLKAVLDGLGIAPERRPQETPLQQYGDIANVLADYR